MKVVHFADLHLDSLFRRLGPDTARGKRRDVRDALTAILNLAQEVSADAVFSAGDLFEHDSISPDTENFLRSEFARVDPIRVFLAPGNHDWYGPSSPYARIAWSHNVHVFKSEKLEAVELEPGLRLWGAGFTEPHRTRGFLDGFEARGEGSHVGLFHGSEKGLYPSQDGKENYAPFTIEQVRDAGLLHVFTGHFHKPTDNDVLTYPGNPEPLEFGEDGTVPRGAVIAVVEDGKVLCERRSVASTPMVDVSVPVTGSQSSSDVLSRVREALTGVKGIVRLSLEGDLDPAVDLREQDLRGVTADGVVSLMVGQHRVFAAYDLPRFREEQTVRGQFVRDVEASDMTDEDKRRVLYTGLRALDGRDDLEVL